MFVLALLLSSPSDIVVTGQRLIEAQAKCVKGGCTPLQDAKASIALAEVQFRDGDYVKAKKLLSAAISRNRKNAAEAPRAVAALYEAHATVALHEGDKEQYRRATVHEIETLRDNLPLDDPSVIRSATVLGDMWITLRRYRQAEIVFKGIQQQALANGQNEVAFLADMKRAWLAAALGRDRKSQQIMSDLEMRPLARKPAYQTGLQVLRIRMLAFDKDEAVDAKLTKLAAALGQVQSARPTLLYSPPYKPDSDLLAEMNERQLGTRTTITPEGLSSNALDISGNNWVDIGFWVRPDGRTAEIEILRGSRFRAWAGSALNQIAGRRYSATTSATMDTANPGVYHIERYTKRTAYTIPVGSRIKRRVATGGYDILDLTETPSQVSEST